ncbi:hypothetical protein [Aureimonas mangrovi]|uniref:hypothetical protein n=1 Tax=Aureimonas mangrovi TaxID=2758041 RepID=UPI00163D459C|nr:hypothetical protein [Aureimonas mangrovi]
MIVLRVYRGVADHFQIRLSEWMMLWPSFGLWLAFQVDPEMFSKSPSYAYLEAWATQNTWAAIVALAGLCRLMALTINGTFKGFAFSPHIRGFASLVGVVVWSQISLGFLVAYVSAGGAPSGVIAWSTMVILEFANTYRSFSDIGKNAAERG